ncbi:MAG: hypothetical protein OXH00_16830 [Candidatus Poribacteria bacterium]|nr:hypothetical protein [Candidatus Poribacteria bacterium]
MSKNEPITLEALAGRLETLEAAMQTVITELTTLIGIQMDHRKRKND